jgi:hypothetical protein
MRQFVNFETIMLKPMETFFVLQSDILVDSFCTYVELALFLKLKEILCYLIMLCQQKRFSSHC